MTSIEWTHRPGTKGESWNPIRARNLKTGKIGWHCTHASDGCRNCYAERLNLNRRGLAFGTGLPYKPGHEQAAGSAEGATGAQRDSVEIFVDDKTLAQPLRWREPRTIFVCSMTDLFGAFVPDTMIDRAFAVAALCPQHTFIVLTKRSARMREYLNSPATIERMAERIVSLGTGEAMPLPVGLWRLDGRGGTVGANRTADGLTRAQVDPWPLPNIWLGVSAERQQEADERIPDLLATPSAIRFVSLEPLLGPIDLTPKADATYQMLSEWYGPDGFDPTGSQPRLDRRRGWFPRLNWVIVGGESGPGARPMHPDWARSLRDQCAAAGVPFFFKQWGSWASVYDRQVEDPNWDRCDIVARKTSNGQWLNLAGGQGFHGERVVRVDRLTKKAAGRLLDGVEHNGWPSSPLEGEDGKARQAAGEPLAAPGEG